jgi:hypothetical protein
VPNWLIKWAVHRAIAAMPRRQRLNEFFQTHFSRTLELSPAMFETRLNDCRTHLENFLELRSNARELKALELGPGWYPTVALGLYLCGAEEIWLFDIERLLRSERLSRLVALFAEFEREKKLQQCLPRLDRDRFSRLMDAREKLKTDPPETWLEGLNIHLVLRDVRESELPPGTVDLFYSTVVLEYVPAAILPGILKEFHRIGSDRAIMSHCIGLLDQMSFFDKSLSPYNYLKYTDAQWRFWSSPLIRQNRLMVPDYRKLLSDAGYEVTKEISARGRDADFDRVKLAPQFSGYKREDLMVLRSWIVARPRAALQTEFKSPDAQR